MTTYNSENERVKKDYFIYLKEANRKAKTTINGVRKSILRYEEYTKLKPFKSFNKDQAIAFKKHLMSVVKSQSGEPLAKSTILSTLNNLKAFFIWLSYKPGFKSNIHFPDIEYLNLSENETRAAKAPKNKIFPTLEQIHSVIFNMPNKTDVEKRNQALIAFTILTGLRDGAVISLKLKHIDVFREHVNQDPNEVHTKFSKKIDTYFFQIGDDIKAVFTDWISFLLEQKQYSLNDPLFPRTALVQNSNNEFTAFGLEAKHWENATSMRLIFKKAFRASNLPNFTPHKFRDTIVHIGQQKCTTPEEFKAWSQNLGHESPLTTFTSYGHIDHNRQGDLIKQLGEKNKKEDRLEEMMSFLESKLGDK